MSYSLRWSIRCTLLVCGISWHASSQTAWESPEIARRVDSVLVLMTTEEKVGQLNQITGEWDRVTNRAMISDGLKREIKAGRVGAFLNITGTEITRDVQRVAVEQSRLHIPLLFGLDVIHGFRTIFPIPLAEASSWDPEAVELSARIAATEATALGVDWTFAPMVDIARDPRWGRIAEGSGEDPFLGSAMAAARVRGFQGSDFADSTTLLACAKHFAAYGGAEAGRDYNTVDISERTLREIYLPPFRAAVDAGAATLMSSFNEIAGVPSTANRKLLTGILRDEWGFRGFVVSDWNAIEELQKHGIAASQAEAALKALSAGVDMDMASGLYRNHLPGLASSGALAANILDGAVRRVLRVKFALGLFEHPYRNCNPELARQVILTPHHRDQARKIAGESIVLLKNDGGLLPLRKDLNRIAVIGPLARSKDDALGPWDGAGRAGDVVSVIEGIRGQLSSATRITYAPGCDSTFRDTSGFGEAVLAARDADAVLLVVGETRSMTGEAASRSDLGLPGVQEELVRRIRATGRPLVMILMNGRPLCIPWEAEHVPAIVETWFLGVEAGNAIADVLFGDVNPGGKLPSTFPRSVGQIPLYYNHKNTGRPYSASDRFTTKYLDIPNTPEFPFGFGLSYTTFAYSNLRALTSRVRPHADVRIRVDVKNTGARAGDEVVQLYVHRNVASITPRVRELKGFKRVSLRPGETRTIEFTISGDRLGLYDENMAYVVEPGTFTAYAGGDSECTLETSFELVGQ